MTFSEIPCSRGYCLHGRLNRIDHPVRLKKWPEVRTAWAFNYEAAARLTGYAKQKSIGGR
jgi:hypothetical protein